MLLPVEVFTRGSCPSATGLLKVAEGHLWQKVNYARSLVPEGYTRRALMTEGQCQKASQGAEYPSGGRPHLERTWDQEVTSYYLSMKRQKGYKPYLPTTSLVGGKIDTRTTVVTT